MITGTLLDDGIAVTAQRPMSAESRPALPIPRWESLPCPEPDGGWPTGTQQDIHATDWRDLESAASCVGTVLTRPRPDSVVLVVSCTDGPAGQAAWRTRLGDRVCFVPSRWSNQQLDAVTETLLAHWRDWTLVLTSRPTDEDFQQHVDAELLSVTPDMAAWAVHLPDGIFEVRPTLIPMRG